MNLDSLLLAHFGCAISLLARMFTWTTEKSKQQLSAVTFLKRAAIWCHSKCHGMHLPPPPPSDEHTDGASSSIQLKANSVGTTKMCEHMGTENYSKKGKGKISKFMRIKV